MFSNIFDIISTFTVELKVYFLLAEAIHMTVVPIRILIRTTVVPITPLIGKNTAWFVSDVVGNPENFLRTRLKFKMIYFLRPQTRNDQCSENHDYACCFEKILFIQLIGTLLDIK